MNGDTVFNFGLGTTIDILGAQIGRTHLVVSHFAGTTTVGTASRAFCSWARTPTATSWRWLAASGTTRTRW